MARRRPGTAPGVLDREREERRRTKIAIAAQAADTVQPRRG
jgi:hypothetical protein